MAENIYRVHDIVHPSPVTLQEISSIAVAIQLWRWELQQYGPNRNHVIVKLYQEEEFDKNFSWSDGIPNLPSTIDCMIKKCHLKLVVSIHQWLEYNFRYIFGRYRDNPDDILKDFSDIVCDCDGTVHYDRTAKRMLLCEQINPDEKFIIACTYCFEDDIRQIWPSVKSKMDLNMIYFGYFPHLYYWVCHIRNELHKIPDQDNDSIEKIMLEFDTKSRSVFEYFWNRISSEKQTEVAVDFCQKSTSKGFYFKFILPNLNKQQILQLLDTGNILNLFYYMMQDFENVGSREYVLPVWMCIKDNFDETTFNELVRILAQFETDLDNRRGLQVVTELKSRCNDEILTLCCDVWNSAPHHLKQAAIKYLFDDDRLLQFRKRTLPSRRQIRFLSVVLSDVTLEERSIFWHNSWIKLLKSTHRTDFLKIMNFCLKEEQIRQFKETALSNHENINDVIESYIENLDFQKLKDLVNFCCSDQRSKRIWNRNILQLNNFRIFDILDPDNLVFEPMREYIDDAYADDPDIATDFINNLVSELLRSLTTLVEWEVTSLNIVIQFVDTFASFIQNLNEVKKKQFVDALRNYIISGPVRKFSSEEVQKFLLWCLNEEDDDEMIKFKQSISPDQVVRNMLRNGNRNRYFGTDPDTYERRVEYIWTLDPFLSWYFVTPEEIVEFKIRLADVFK